MKYTSSQLITKAVCLYVFQFVEDRVDRLNSGIGFNDEFEIECNYFEERNGTSSSQTLKQQYKDWAKNVKKGGGVFFKNVKDKVCIIFLLLWVMKIKHLNCKFKILIF